MEHCAKYRIYAIVYFLDYTHEYTRVYTRNIPLVYFAYRTNFELRIFRVSSNVSRALMEDSLINVSGHYTVPTLTVYCIENATRLCSLYTGLISIKFIINSK